MIFIADNTEDQLATLQWLLKKLFPNENIWPADAIALTNWESVREKLLAYTTNTDELLVILDLGLEAEHYTSVTTGVKRANMLRNLRDRAVFLAFTQWPDAAKDVPHYQDTFDGLIDKPKLHELETPDDQINYLRQVISTAKSNRHGKHSNFEVVDSLGLRLAAAAFGNHIFDLLTQEVAHDWDEVKVTALTSGHSGAFLLEISGKYNGGVQRLIVKCARNRETIEGETNRVGETLAELGPLAGVMGPINQKLQHLPEGLGYYYKQAAIKGDSLESILIQSPWGEDAKQNLDVILGLEFKCYNRSFEEPYARINPVERFPLSPIDLGRVRQSLKFLSEAGFCCESLSLWPEDIPSAMQIAEAIAAAVESWDDLLSAQGELFAVGQHGDLNLGNVLVPAPGQVVLIDFSRLGMWPVGYDIGRLTIMLRIRLTDHDHNRDWVENRLKLWVVDKLCQVNLEQSLSDSVCPSATYAKQQFRWFLDRRPEEERLVLERGYQTGMLWDLIKVLSYTDLSPFKRIWAMIECWRLVQVLSTRT